MRLKALLLAATACGSALAVAQPAKAQTSQLSEIIVTARKRQESILNVPVIETALPQEQLERLQTRDLKDIGKFVPGLNFGTGNGLSGVQLSIRGVGTTTSDPAIEQTVVLNIDGVPMSQGLAFTSGVFDMGQAEVLKGPQSLFYGKSSPGGVISLRSADPTNQFELIGRAGYEFEAREKRGEMIVSGPITDTLKARLSAMYDQQDGYFYNAAIPDPGTGARTPDHSRIGGGNSYILRGTVLWNPIETFNARLKYNITHDRTYFGGAGQMTSCPTGGNVPALGAPNGIPFIGGGEDCRVDRTFRVVSLDPADFPTLRNDGEPVLDNKQQYGSLELNWRPRPDVTLTSLTGYYENYATNISNGTNSTFAGASILVQNDYRRYDRSEEVRLNTDFTSPFNLTAGVFYSSSYVSFTTQVASNAAYRKFVPFPPLLSDYTIDMNIKTWAPFAQVRWNPIPKLEIAAGARWTDDKRVQTDWNQITGAQILVTGLPTPEIHSKKWTPELTVTYKPQDNITIFGSLKEGHKAGSFNVAAVPSTTSDDAYHDETVKGGEVGFKSRLFDRTLALDVAAYDYKYSGLQVGVIEAANGVPQSRTINAGSARTYGVDFAAVYHPPQIENLTLNFNAEYNHGRFIVLKNVPCYGGQTIAMGCVITQVGAGMVPVQDLGGTPLPRAPAWQLNFGFDYEKPLSDGRTIVISNTNSYYSRYIMFPGTRADFYQNAFFKSDLSVSVRGKNDKWEIAVIGKDLTDKITLGGCSNSNYQTGALFALAPQGTTTSGPSGIDGVGCRTDRGREVWVRLTLKPFSD